MPVQHGALVMGEQMLQTMLDAIPARVVVIDREHRFVYLNQEAVEFVGRPAEQLLGLSLAAVVGQAAYEQVYRPLHTQLFEARQGQRREGWVEYPGGLRRYVQEHFLPYAPDGATVQAVIVLVRDLTGLKLREAELQAKVEQLEVTESLKAAIVDHALAAIVSTDEGGHIVEFNPAAEAMFGRRRADVLGLAVGGLIVPLQHRDAHRAGLERMRGGASPRIMGRRIEMTALRADGSEFPVEMVLWRADAGGRLFYTASMFDLTDRRRAAQEIERQRDALRQSDKLTAMGSLLAGVAHELNNPLAIVMGRASLLEDKCETAPELQHDARRIREAAERCGRIVRTFLNMARSRPAQRTVVALNELVLAAAEMLAYTFRSHGIEVTMKLAPQLPAVRADPDQIGQILLNLLVNAQHALAAVPAPRRLQLATGVETRRADREPRVWLRVVDNGPGVPPALRAQLFQSFFTTKPEGVGTGLGLAVSRSLARDHGGELMLEESPEGGGACFRLSLPISGEGYETTEPVPLAAGDAPASTRVLVVDDETEIADLIRAMLESAGCEVANAESGAVALELLAEARFDAIVSDLRMPDMDGAALWREVRARWPQLARRMLFVTGDTLSPSARRFLDEARAPSLDKPFARGDLLEQLRALLGT